MNNFIGIVGTSISDPTYSLSSINAEPIYIRIQEFISKTALLTALTLPQKQYQ